MCKQFSDAHTSAFAQAAATHYLKAGRFTTLANVRKVYAERATAMGNTLKRELGMRLNSLNHRAACSFGPGFSVSFR